MLEDARQRSEAAPAAEPSAAAPAPEPAPGTTKDATTDSAPAADAKTAPSAPADPKTAAEVVEGKARSLFGALAAEERIRQSAEQNRRTLWASAIAVTLIYAGLIFAQAFLAAHGGFLGMSEPKQDRLGQDADTISVELVPDPDKTSKTTKWREGMSTAEAPPQETPPAPPQVASLEQPKAEEAPKEEEVKPEDAPTAEQPTTVAPTLPDLDTVVDAAAADLDRKIKEHLEQKKQQERQRQQRQAAAPIGGLQVRGSGASGRSDPFSRSVIAALMKTRPGPFALWGRVLVSFQISETGQLAYVHLLQSSGNSALDQAAISAIRKAQFQRPPPGLSPDQRTYIIDYIFG